MATKKPKAEWPFPAGKAPKAAKAKKPTKKELAAQKEAEQNKLIETLKFTPRSYNVSMWGYGGEYVMGTISREIYDYFKENRLSVSDFAWDYDYAEAKEIPEEMWPFQPGSWHECDDICHTNGVSKSAGHIQVDDESGNEILNRELDTIDGTDIELSINDEYWPGSIGDGVVFIGRSNEKGTFFEAELPLTAPFDQEKLTLVYDEVEDEAIVYTVSYDGEDLDNYGGSTDGKSSDFYFYLVEDGEIVETYSEPVSDYINYWPEDYEQTTAFKFNKKNRPPMPGDYKCTWSPGFGTSYGTLEWDGERWLEYEYDKPKEVTGVKDWAGLNWDTSDMKNKPKRKPRTPKTGIYPYPSQDTLKMQELKEELESIEVPKHDAECVQCDWKGTVDECNDWDGQIVCPECGEPVELKE